MSKFIAFIAESYIGSFIELDKENFNVSLFTETRIQNVAVKPDLLSQFVDSPIYGHVETISINPNFGNTDPITVTIDGIYVALLLTNADLSKSIDPVEAKRRRLAANDIQMKRRHGCFDKHFQQQATHKQEQQEQQRQQQQNGNEISTSEKISRKLLKRISVKISNVHIRVETDGACFGITLKSLILGTNRSVSEKDSTTPRNTLRMEGLSIYVDPPNAPGVTCPSKREEFVRYLAETEGTHEYVLHPYSATANLHWPLSLEKSSPPQARYVLSGDLDSLVLRLSKEQYSRIFVSLDSLKRQIGLPPAIREKRPLGTVKEEPLKWFAYAAEAALYQVKDRKRRLTPEFFEERFEAKKKYCKLYKLRLLGKLTRSTSRELEAMEDTLKMEDIVFYRSFAVAELSKKFQNKMKVDLTKSVSPLTKEEIEEFEIVQPPKPPAPTPQSQQKASQQSPVLLQNSSSNNTKFARLFSKFRTSLKTIQKEVSEKTTKEIAEDNDADKEDITLEHAGVKDVPVFKMDLKVQDFEIVLEDKHATEPSPVLTVKTNLGVSLVMPTQSSTVTTVNIDNLYGIGDKGTEFVSYNPSRGASGRTEPFIVLGVTADRGKTVLKARMQPVDILLRGTVVSRIVEYGMPPPQVNVKELGTQVWSYVYTYVLLAQDIEDSDGSDGDGEGKRIKAGPGKALENLQMDIAVDSPSIHALSESAADTVVNVQKIRFSSVDTGSEATKGLELLVEGISLETPGDEKEPRAEIVLPFNVNFVLGLPVLDTKKECDSVCVTGHVGSIQVHGNEDTVKHIMNVSKPFCAMLAPLVVGYVNAVSQNMDEKFAAGGGTLSNDKIEMTPVKFDVHADGMSVTWSSKKSTIAPVTLDVSKGAAFHGGLAHYCFSGEVKLPLLTVLNGRQDDHAPILAVTDICVEIEETAYVSCTVELDTVDVNFDAGSTMGAVSDILSTVQRMAPVVNEDFVKVAEENPVSPAAHSGKANLYSVCLNVKQLKAKAWDKEGEVIFLANSLTTDISHKKKDLIAVTIEFSTTSAKAKGNETSYLTLLDLGSSDPKIKRQSLRLSVTSGDSQAYDVCVGLHHICVNTVGIESAAGLFTRMTRQVKEALSLPEASAGDGGLNKMLFGTGSFPSVRMDVDLSEISVEFVPGYVRNVDFKFYVSKVAYKNTDECPCGKVFVRGVDLFALGSLLNLKQIDIEVVPLLRVSREPEEKLFVEVSAAVSDVVLALTPMLLPGLSFVSIGSIAQLFSTTTDTNPFPSFLVVDVTKASVPHIEVHMLPNKETTSSNSNNDQSTDNLDDVMKVVIEGLSVSGKLIDVKQRIEISGDTLCVVPNNDNYIQGSLVQEYELGKCAVFTIERRIDNDAFRYNIDGTINRVSIAEFNDTFLLQRMVPFANQIKFDFGDLVLPSSCKKDKVPTFVSLKINLNSDVSLDYAGRARLCIRSPLSVAFNLKFHGTVLGYALAVDAKNELFASDYKYNKVLSILGLSLELNTDFESAKNTCLQLVVPQISLGFWPGVLSDIVAPVMKGVLAPSLSSQDRAVVCVSVREPAVVPEFMDMWEVKVDVKKIGVDVRRLANSKDCNIVLNVTELSAEALLEKGKAVSPAILTRAKLKLAKAYTVCDEFTLPFADETSVKARSEDGALVLTATSININVQRSNLAVFYAVFHSIPRIVASIPSFGADAVQDAEPIAVNLSASVPSVSVKWVNCFTCAAEGISAKCNGEEWRVDVKRLTASDEHADKMVDLPILALNESSCDSGEKPSVRVTGRRSSESGSLVVAVDVSIIDMFFTPEIIGTVASDVVWMKNYNDYNYDNNSSNTPSNETIGKDEEAATKKQNEAKVTAKPKSRVELRFNIERISACVYEDHTAEYCLGKFHVSLDHFLLGLANTTSGTDLELFSVAVKDLSVEAGFGCYAINKGGKVQRKDDTIKVVVVACNKIDINLTDGVSSSFYVEADPLSVSVNAELLVPFIENHAKKIKVSFASASTDSKVDKRHFDTKHQNWNIPAQEAELQKQIIEKRFTPIQDNDGDNDAKPSKVMQITTGLKRFLEKKIVVKKINLCGVVVDFFAPTTKSRVNLALFGVKCSLNNTQQRTLQFCLNASTSNEKDSSPLIIPWEVNLMVIDMGYPSVQFTSNNLELSLDSHSLKFLCDVLDCFQASDPESGSCIVSGESEKTQNVNTNKISPIS